MQQMLRVQRQAVEHHGESFADKLQQLSHDLSEVNANIKLYLGGVTQVRNTVVMVNRLACSKLQPLLLSLIMLYIVQPGFRF